MKVQIINKSKFDLPKYETSGSAGLDLKADLDRVEYYENGTPKLFFDAFKEKAFTEIVIAPNGRCLVPTGIFIKLPDGYEANIRPRSGLAIKEGITVLNSPGTIDAKLNF
jgi:dUTP pyrophosphatase